MTFHKYDILTYVRHGESGHPDNPIDRRFKVVFYHYDSPGWAKVRFMDANHMLVTVNTKNLRP